LAKEKGKRKKEERKGGAKKKKKKISNGAPKFFWAPVKGCAIIAAGFDPFKQLYE
jgi:hypothetical protein